MTKKSEKKNTTKVLLISLIAALLLVTAYLLWTNFQQKNEMKEMVELMEFEKEQLEDEYEELAIQFDGYQTQDIHNDSLVELLSQEKQRVQDLLDHSNCAGIDYKGSISFFVCRYFIGFFVIYNVPSD